MQIADNVIGGDHPCFLIAEAGVNHNGDLALAHKLVDAAAEAGADAVKFQTFQARELVTAGARKADYQLETTGGSDRQMEMLEALELSREAHIELMGHCSEAGIIFLSTPYDEGSLALLDSLDVAAIKIGSSDVTNIPLLRRVAAVGRPVVLSTGMASLAEVEQGVGALAACRDAGRLALLQCTSQYPAPLDEINLRAMDTLRHAFACPVGYSDHTEGIEASVWAVAAGAALIEKHFTLDRALPGPDHRASLEPGALEALVQTVRRLERALGDGAKRITPSEEENKARMQKRLVARRPIAEGQPISAEDLACKRSDEGLGPDWWDRVIGRRTRRPIEADQPLRPADVAMEE